MTTTTVYLVRHAESAPRRDLEEPAWPLSPTGMGQARRLVRAFAGTAVDAIFTSPFRRAEDTVTPLARDRGLPVHVVDDLRERRLAEGWLDDFMAVLELAWTDLDYAHEGGESGTTCQRRVWAAVRDLVVAHPGRTLVAASHGNAIGLYLNHLDPTFGFTRWKAIRTPDVFRVRFDGNGPAWDRDFPFHLPEDGTGP